MPRTALAAYVLFLLVAFVLRAVIQVRRTGPHRLRVAVRDGRRRRTLRRRSLFTAALLAAAAAPLLQLAGVVAPLAALDRPLVHAIGLAALGFGGIALTLWAQLGMGDSWRVGVDATERTALVTGGPFGVVRNPIFSADAARGRRARAPRRRTSSRSAPAIALLVAVEIQVRRVEEPYLETHAAASAYRRYAATVGRQCPALGRRADFVPALGHRMR